MRRLAPRLIVCLLIVLAVPCAILGFAFGLPAQYDRTYPAALWDKLDRLQAAQGKRIILLGGSGAAFGVRSDLLEDQLPGYTAVNLGLYAGLGTAVMLDLAEPYLRPGDVAVFMPEQSRQTLSTYFNAAVLWQAADGRGLPWSSLNAEERRALIGALPAFAGAKARLFFSGEKPMGDAIYARRSLNAYGDMACAGREQNIMPGGYDPNMPISFDPALMDDGLAARLNALAAACERKGAALYYAFCPMNAAAVPEPELARADAFAAAVSAALRCPVLGAPQAAVLDPAWFFDTNFHLNEAGQVAYTARLARWLKDVLGDPSPVSIAIPALPGPAAARTAEGDNTDAACFVYAAREDGVWIVGLTDEGAARESLVVPAMYDQRPVLGFDAAVFAGNRSLRTLTLGANIAMIPNESFAGCAALERIILKNAHPETVSVGAGLLQGTNACVAVPASSFSAFAANYFWSPHAHRLVENPDE